MPPTLLAPDRQATYKPVWFMKCAQFPRTYATRDIDVPFVTPGVGFNVGDSVVGGDDLVGGGAGPLWRQAYRGILNTPVVTRKIGEPQWPMVDVQDVTVEIQHDGELLGDWRGAPFTLSAYDAESGFLLLTGAFVIVNAVHNRHRVTITGKNVDLSILEAQIPKGTITLAEFPLAAPDAIGQTPTWLLGNVTNLPLPNVRDDQIKSQFDYLPCRDSAAALTGLRRVLSGGANPFVEMTLDELEPYPGMDAFPNLGFEDWDAGVTSAPDGWTLTGAGGSVAKNITAGQFVEGSASASVTRAGANTTLTKDLMADAPFLPASWWQGREITITARVRATTATQARLSIIDSAGPHNSFPYHSGSGLFETLSWTVTLDAATTVVTIQVRVENTAGTVQFDDVRIYLRAKNWNECLRPDLYPGSTAIRTFLRQEDASGALLQLVADVHGLQPERNPVRAIRTMLSDPTHGLGKPVDATTFDAAEAALCFTYEDVVNLDGPEVFLPFRDAFTDFGLTTQTLRDRSGHERHGTYHFGPGQTSDNFYAFGFGISETTAGTGGGSDAFLWCQGDGDWISIEDDAAFSGQTITVELWFEIMPGGLPDANPYPIIEKTIAGASFTQWTLYRQSNVLAFAVRCADTNLYTVTSPLVDVTDENRWMLITCTAGDGILQMFRDGVLVATASYAAGGLLMEGSGQILVAKFGTPSGAITTDDIFAKPVVYSHVLSAARVAAHFAAKLYDATGAQFFYDNTIETRADLVDSWRGDESAGGTSIAGVNVAGTWNGSPALTAGPLTAEYGYANSGGGKLFDNTTAKYGVVTGQTYTLPAGSVLCFYRPTGIKAIAGIVEKTIAGVRDTQWGFCHRGKAVRFTFVTSAGTFTIDAPLLAEDVGRYGLFVASWASGTLSLYKNGAPVTTAAYTGTPTSGVGDFYIGIQGTVAAVRTRPGQGAIGRVAICSTAISAADVARLWLEATWFNGGLVVDAALREPRAARAWLEQICLLRGIRLGMTPDGPITVTCDAVPATTIRLHARDGVGDGERTIKSIGDSQYPPLDETVADVVVRGRRDLLSNAWLVERRRTVHANMGQDKPIELDCVREYPALDRVAAYLAGTILDGEKTVDVTMGQEARQLMEGELVEVTDAYLGYDAAITRAREVRKSLPEHGAVVTGWSETPYTWDPSAFPSGATSG